VSSRHADPVLLDGPDTGSEAERLALLEHVRGCAACRARWLAADASRLFALLRLDEPPQEKLDALSARVMEGVEVAVAARAGSRLRGFAAVAASLLLAAALAASGILRDGSRPLPAVAHGAAGVAGVETAASLAEAEAATAPVRGVELLSSPGAGRVVNLAVGETRVVMIFDKELDL
jgi:hypothetical protein